MEEVILIFHPGKFPILTKQEKRERERKKIREKAKERNRVYAKSSKASKSEFSFENAYKGPIWWTPAGMKVHPEARQIFDTVASKGPFGLQERLRRKYLEPSFYTIRFHHTSEWKSPWSDAFRQYQRETFKKIWKQVWMIYRRFQKVSAILQRALCYWRRRHCLAACRNTEDIVTLEVPKQPVYILDLANRCSYVFEAKTLRIAMEKRFSMCEFMFADPQFPTNPLTNQPLTVGQCYSVIGQLFDHKQFSWCLERFRAGGCNLARFERSFRQYLKMKAISAHFTSEPEDSLETTIDYFQAQAEDAELPEHKIAAFVAFLKRDRTHTFARQWFMTVKQYYLARELNDMAVLVILAKRTNSMLDRVYYNRWV
jgi:hypothetical protein